ncbi:MAG: hypothetical protein PHX62_03600 [Bacilli bacterium]|nr:hypothetical protein [Bacilli bacterium]
MDLKIENLLKNGSKGPVLSKFLSLEEQKQIKTSNLDMLFSNSYLNEERKRAIIFSKDFVIEPNFQIDIYEISFLQPYAMPIF